MKSMIKVLVLLVATAAQASAFAQSSSPVTRAQVKAELIALERAGYNPTADDASYPNGLLAAEARLKVSQGGVGSGTSDSGSPSATRAVPMSGSN